MNRIKLSPLANRPIKDVSTDSENKVPESLSSKTNDKLLPFDQTPDTSDSCLLLPLHYEKNYEYPLVVWLHDNGDDAEQLHRVMPNISLQNFVAASPQAAVGNRSVGYYWEQDEASIDQAADSVLATIDMARCRANINSRKIFIAGYGAAGTMAFRVAFTHPDLFAGIASINGPLPQGFAPLGRWSSSRNLEVFWSHYRKSDEFSQDLLCRQLKLLHVAGFSVTLRQYPGGDDLTNAALGDLNRWIMQMFESTIS